MSLQKLTAALASGNAELQLALATLNLDVSLVKMEAPREFRPLALALPSKRKNEAEDGRIHATVRKLQSLFSGLYTITPALYSAYGERSSYISQQAKPDEKYVKAGGPFAEHIGVEAGSIWAAATSGTTAVAVHLLACMLARLFSGPEAVAAWEEIVAIRKKQVLDETEAGATDNISALLAAKSPLHREDLAEWDASARAWLRVADEVMQAKQKQLLLIINNQQELPVNIHGTTFDSIIQAWSRTMDAVDKLIKGMPHSIVDGSVLLALSAWHIYPDMLVLGDKNVVVQQNDDLVTNGGILTLGLQRRQQQIGASMEGVTWSLPLAYYRYYGTPTITDRNLQTDGARLSIRQLLLVVIGSLMSKWTEKTLTSTQMANFVGKVFTRMVTTSSSASRRDNTYQPSAKSWPSLLRAAAEAFGNSNGVESEEGSRLIAFGRRRCGEFLGLKHVRDSPISQLQRPPVLLGLVRTADDRVNLLRRVARRLSIPSKQLLIRYAIDGPDRGMSTRYGYANVSESGIANSGAPLPTGLYRWESQARPLPERIEKQLGLLESNVVRAPVKDDLRLFWCDPPTELQADELVETGVDDFFGHFAEKAIFKKLDPAKPRKLKGVPFFFVLGDPSTAAIYQAYESPSQQNYLLRAEEILTSLDVVNQSRLQAHLIDLTTATKAKSEITLSKHIRSLKAIATIIQIYEPLSSATIATSLVKHPIAEAKWLTELKIEVSEQVVELNRASLEIAAMDNTSAVTAMEPLALDRPSTFACIAMMESGDINIPPDGLDAVMALSSGDSLFVACQLVNDPVKQPSAIVTHIRGNIGRPGISMMIPPSQDLYTMSVDDWNQIDHKNFDGELRDSFKSTSLHLSFTDFTLAVDTGLRGTRTSEVTLLETVVSVHERGLRVADVDILSLVDAPLLRIISSDKQCNHSGSIVTNIDDDSDDETLVSLDSWTEFLDYPVGTGVFRARGNWQARLAAAVLSVSRDFLTLVFEGEVCWECGRAESNRMRHKTKKVYLI